MPGPSQRVRLALDAMGGDYGPQETVKGAIEAAKGGDVEVLLVGDPAALQAELEKHRVAALPVKVVPAEGVIQEGEHPVQALRQKPRASIVVAAGLVKQGAAQGFVTMGSTGAAMAAAALTFGLMEGIERPALGGPIIGLAPRTVIIDLGSSVDCRPSQLVSFAALGSAFAKTFLGVEQPRVALLSVGAEEGKGNRQAKETYELLKASGQNFVGNVEGHDLPLGRADVVVCDGFVGNILMKLTEGLGEGLAQHLRSRLGGRPADAEAVAQEVYDLLNAVERAGGGPLLGVKGVAVVGHGRSRAPAVASALHTAMLAVQLRFVEKMYQELAALRRPDAP
ncbi:MAG: phosphate acyltransferase PlsX [Chloroflexi bacterium]|nr:phosphate acyltransferase PlsX [Chloroflexota bacterium]